MLFPKVAVPLLLMLAACGSSSRPGASSPAPQAQEPRAAVSITVPPPIARPTGNIPRALQASIETLARNFDGRAGIAVRAVDEGWTVEAGGRQRLPQQSVSKLWVAITVLDQRDQGKVRLDQPITVLPTDLTLFHQPIAYLVAKTGRFDTTVGGLLTRALTQSDNTANDRLLTLVGGPEAVRRMIAAKRLGDIRFGPGERMLQAGTAGLVWQPAFAIGNGFEIARSRLSPEARAAALDRYVADPPDGAAPLAIADAISRVARGELLSETSTRILLDTMGASITGRARLRAAIPAGWKIAHKTGTGQDLGGRNAGFNDVGLLTAPDGRRYALAVMIGDTRRPIRERQMLIQNVAATVASYAGSHPGSAFASTIAN
ncbi:serine hydrolase [Sphingomonas sp. Leaf339]|uniref:serine hydrolase n=1 Tax=Sphingomonas sp. Leaf339 TaxID=1736343 RepID=UPI000A54C468|nr:serine hydrolase [Sphingomonas sp. Leaf339]